MMILSELNDTNVTCPLSLLWSQSVINGQLPALYICIVATITHSIFWLQFFCSPSVRSKTMQWLYAYLITDILLLIRFFFAFIVHTTSNECTPNPSWSLFVCYIEATVDNYMNILEVYMLFALNLCRYAQIALNKNVYVTHVRLLIFSHLTINLLPLIIVIIQLSTGWAHLKKRDGGSCDIVSKNVYVQAINIIFEFALPILLNIFILYCNIRHVHSTSRLSQTQHHVTAREKYHRSLVIQLFVFYTVWLLLWSPNIIVYQFTTGASYIAIIASLLNYIEIALDPIIISALDVRFKKIWRNLWIHFKYIICCKSLNQQRIAPIKTSQNI